MLRVPRRDRLDILAAALAFGAAACGGDRALVPLSATPSTIERRAAAIPTVCPDGSTRWGAPVNGNWTDPARWTAGVPTATVPACIDLPGAYVVTLGGAFTNTIIPVRGIFVGAPGAATQPVLRVVRSIIQVGTDVTVHGALEVAPPLSQSASVTISGALQIASTGMLSGPGDGGKSIEASTIESDGTIHSGNLAAGIAGLIIRAATLVNRGAIVVPHGNRFLRFFGPSTGGTLTLTLESGSVSVVGARGFDQNGGTIFVKGGSITGAVRLLGMSEVVLEHDVGGQISILPVGVTTTLARGTVGPNTHVWMGNNSLTVRTSGLTNQGRLTIEAIGTVNGQPLILRTDPGATIVNEGELALNSPSPFNAGANVYGAITNEASGVIVHNGGCCTAPNIAGTPLINRGTLRPATGQIRVLAAPGGSAPEVILEGGTVESTTGRYQQTGGTMTVTGGTVSGQLDLIALTEVSLQHDAGGRLNLFRLGGLVPPTTTRLRGTVGATQEVWMGSNHLTVNADGVVNHGDITVQHTMALSTTGTVLRSVDEPLTNAEDGTITMIGNGGPTLFGSVVNDGLITNAAHVALRPNPLINRGIVRAAAAFQMNAVPAAGEPAPIFVNDGGRLDVLGNYTQTGGRFEHLDGTVTGTAATNFNSVRFSGFGTWGRSLTLAASSVLAPGTSPGRIAITGDYNPSATTVTQIQLGGAEAGAGYDQVTVSGTARFAGSLSVSLIDGFAPRPCQTFDVVTYGARTNTFSNAATPIDVGGGMKLRQVYTATKLVLVAYSANGPNVSPTEVEVNVDGTTATYDVCIGAGADVITVEPENQVLVDKATLTFGVSQLPQTVTVSAAPGANRPEAFIRHQAASNIPVATVRVTIVGAQPADTDPPVTTASATPGPNANGWNNDDVVVQLSATDDVSGVAGIEWSLSGAQAGGASVPGSSASVTISAEGLTTLTYFARDAAGNQEAPKTLDVHIDRTAPTVSVMRDPAPNANGWNTTAVTATFTADDELSGVDGDATIQVVFDQDGANQGASRTFTDRAGNQATATITGISIDRVAPAISCSANPAEIWPPNGQLVTVEIQVITDGASGFVLEQVSSNEPGPGDVVDFESGTPDVTGRLRAARLGGGTGRVYTFTYRAFDEAGNSATATCQVRVPHDQGKKK